MDWGANKQKWERTLGIVAKPDSSRKKKGNWLRIDFRNQSQTHTQSECHRRVVSIERERELVISQSEKGTHSVMMTTM